MSVSYRIIKRVSSNNSKISKNVALLTLSNPPVNGLSHSLRENIIKSVKKAKEDDKVDAIILVGDGRTFPAGADITEFEWGGFMKEPHLMQVVKDLDGYEKSTKDNKVVPLIAAIHGTALGGGLELALACHYRVAVPSAKVGLPEVHLGLLPGAEGTQRLPRVAGVANALEMIISGKHIPAKKALEYGIVDALSTSEKPEDLLEAALKIAENATPEEAAKKSLSSRTVPKVDASVYDDALKSASKTAKGQVAPINIVKSIKAASETKTYSEGVAEEQRLFQELMAGPQSKAMQYMFFADRDCQKVPGVDSKMGKDIKHVGIIGAGTMGGGIAMCFMNKGVKVTLCETKEELLTKGLKVIEDNYKKSGAYKSGKMTDSDVAARMGLVNKCIDPSLQPLSECDAVIEAVFENLELKQQIFKKLDKVCKPGALLCTNTSYLDIDQIASVTSRPETVMGTHFFSPANVMPLLENVRGSKSSNETIATAMKMGKNLGKTSVLVGNCFGFIGNRMFEPYTQQAILMLEEGASPSQIDTPLGPGKFGMAMGPLAVFDLAGNDIGYRIRRESYYPYKAANVKGKRGATWMALADELCDKGRYGQKKGAGWYKYEGRAAKEDEEVTKMISQHAKKYSIAQRKHTEQEIIERCLLTMANEGFKILEEKIALRASDIDVVWNYGYGFPRYRGGPMHYADQVIGLQKMKDSLLRYQDAQPELPEWHFKPSNLLEELIKSKTTLSQYDKKKPSKR